MYAIPRRSLKLTIQSCEALPPISSDALWAHEPVRSEHHRLTRRRHEALQALQAICEPSPPHTLPRICIDPNQPGSPALALYMQHIDAIGKLQDFEAMYGDSPASNRRIAPNCYACVTLERNSVAPPLAVTKVRRANYDPCWNKTIEDINIDLMLLCSEMESPTYLYCQRLRIAVYHDFGFGQEAASTGWEPAKACDGHLIGEAFLAVGDLFADPCQKTHQLKVYGPDHALISGCTLQIVTKVSCSSAKVPPMFPCQSAFPTMMPVEVEKDCDKGCGAADVSLSGCDSITIPSAVHCAVQSSKSSRKCKCKSKSKCKSKHSHRC